MKPFSRYLTALCIAIPCVSATSLFAQHNKYSRTVGSKDRGKVIIDRRDTVNGYVVEMILSDRNNVFTIDKKFRTTKWEHSNSSENSQYTITLQDGIYHIKGMLKGNKIEKAVKSNGSQWIQNVTSEAARLLNCTAGTIKYECFRPDDVSLHTMQAIGKGECEIDGKKVFHVKVCPTGALAKIWNFSIYFDPKTKNLARYEAVEGMPGTPKTVWQ